MKNKWIVVTLFMTWMLLFSIPVSAVKPGNDVNPNGFPSGPHHNLNLIGKKDSFSCPAADEYDLSDGNVIFVPENGEEIKIYMQSGKGKKFEDIDQLQVTDWCAFDSGGATLQLPKHEAGYGVYIRVLAKHNNDPDTDPYLENIMAQLSMAVDENDNQLVYLGDITDGGIRTHDGRIVRNKGKSRAVDITDLFMFTGSICTIFSEDDPHDDTALRPLCCYDDDQDGFYEYCLDAPDTGCEEVDDVAGATVYGDCKPYDDPIWIFNLGEIVDLLWQFDNNGVKTTQIRFYPR
jgi:hypothetical protein